MSTKWERARRLHNSGQFKACRSLLSELLNDDPDNPKILKLIGDINLKLGDCPREHFESLFDVDSKILNSSCARSLFNYGKILLKQRKVQDAERYLKKCLEIQGIGYGAIHYYLGEASRLKSDLKGAIQHFSSATQVQPTVVKYHVELAKALQSVEHYTEAAASYERALELTEHRDAEILNEYSTFLWRCTERQQLAVEFAELAGSIDRKFSLRLKHNSFTKSVEEKMDDNECKRTLQKQSNDVRVLRSNEIAGDSANSTQNGNRIKYSSIKCTIYDFDAALQYLPFQEHVSSNVHSLEMLDMVDLMDIFGKRDRINRMKEHFDKLRSRGIRLGLYIPRNDHHYRDIVQSALQRIYLYSSFDFVVDPYSAHGIPMKHNLESEAILLVSAPEHSAASFQMYPCSERYGASLHDLERIEEGLGIVSEKYTMFTNIIQPGLLSSLNLKLYRKLRLQIIRTHFYDGETLESLEAMQWIEADSSMIGHVAKWREFAEKYMFLTYAGHMRWEWTQLEIADTLLTVEPDDVELISEKARILQSMGRLEESELLFRRSLERCNHVSTCTDYAFFLFRTHRDKECETMFREALKLNPVSVKALIGLGRFLGLRRNRMTDWSRCNAEYYLQKALAVDPHHAMAHVRYSHLLYFTYDDVAAALHHMDLASKIDPNSHKTHAFLGRLYVEIGNMEMARRHLSICLKLNPFNRDALRKYRQHFGEYNANSMEEDSKTFMLDGHYHGIRKYRKRYDGWEGREFVIFWIHYSEFFMRKDADVFQQYHDAFKDEKMDLISKLFEIDRNTLIDIIGIKNEGHVDLILENIDTFVIREYEDFKNWVLSTLGDRTFVDKLMSLMLTEYAVYSTDSFVRNVRIDTMLFPLVGTQHKDKAMKLWEALHREYKEEL